LAQATAASEANALMRVQLQQQQERAADEARAASHANELTRLQLQMQLAQQTAANGAAHILQQQQALNVLKDLPLDCSVCCTASTSLHEIHRLAARARSCMQESMKVESLFTSPEKKV
jgi:hypothetical protein